jgi:uncharacterized membrane protein
MDYQNVKMALATVLLLAVAGCSNNIARESTVSSATPTVEETSEVTEATAADESQVVCFHEKKIGSNRKSLRCMTKADRDKMRDVSQDAWLRQQKGSETGGG